MRRKLFPLLLIPAALSAAVAGCQQPATGRMAVNPTRAIGPYSGAIKAGATLYASGQLGLDPTTGELVKGGILPEVDQALKNLGRILKAGDLEYRDVVSTTVYLSDIKDFDAMNKAYVAFFREPMPARTTVEVKSLPRGARVEIAAIAVEGGTAGFRAGEAAQNKSSEDKGPAFAD